MKMKNKIFCMLMCVAMLSALLTGCGSGGNSEQEASVQTDNTQETSQQDSIPEIIEGSSGNEEDTGSKTLLVYFSPANADTVDAISSATPRTDDISSVEYLAQIIHEHVDSDVAPIVPVEAYPV